MNYKMIKYTLGWLLVFEAIFLTVPAITALVYKELAGLAFVATMLACLAVGILGIFRRPKDTALYSKDGFVVVALSWIVISLFGALPFVISGVTNSYIDALFETVSGFTTTGASIFSEVESLPKCVIMWRSFTHWVGGMGILVFAMAFLPLGGAHNINLMRAESTGPAVSKLVPRVRKTAIILYSLYIALTAVQLVVLLIAKMSFFDAINTAFSTAGTGGFGFRNDSMASFSPAIQIIVTVFMLIFSVNFNSYYLVLKVKFKDAFNTELRVFLFVVITAITVITIDVVHAGIFETIGESIRHVAFSVASIISTTGFATADFNLWPGFSKTVIVLIMFIGGCAGSTAGGIKVSRIVILFKGMMRELGQIIHPKQVKKITLDDRPVEHEVVRSVNAYIVCFLMLFVASIMLLSINEYDLVTNFTAVTATINNIGPGLEAVGPTANFGHFDVFSKLILTFDMLAGRLELFPMLILFSPKTWKKR